MTTTRHAAAQPTASRTKPTTEPKPDRQPPETQPTERPRAGNRRHLIPTPPYPLRFFFKNLIKPVTYLAG